MNSKKDINDSLSSLLECLDRLSRIRDDIERLKSAHSDEVYLVQLVYSIHKELDDAYSFCVMGCGYAEYPKYNNLYYENKEAQAIDAIRCLVSEMIRRLSLMFYNFYLELNHSIDKEEKLPDSTTMLVLINLIKEASKEISNRIKSINDILQ